MNTQHRNAHDFDYESLSHYEKKGECVKTGVKEEEDK